MRRADSVSCTCVSLALVAQWIEQRFPKPCVAGSIPAGGTKITPLTRADVPSSESPDHTLPWPQPEIAETPLSPHGSSQQARRSPRDLSVTRSPRTGEVWAVYLVEGLPIIGQG